MEPRIRIFLLAVLGASLIGCAHQAEPRVNSQSNSSNLSKDRAENHGILQLRSHRANLEWIRAREERRPASPVL